MATTRKQSKVLSALQESPKPRKTYRTCKNSKGQLRKNSARNPKSGKRGSRNNLEGLSVVAVSRLLVRLLNKYSRST